MRPGVRLGIDAGKARVGLAISDPSGLLATPVETLQRSDPQLYERINAFALEHDVFEIIIGLPLNLSGQFTPSTDDAIALAEDVREATHLPIRMLDERLSTVSAHAQLRDVGKKQRGTRSVIDQVAAVMVLQHALDSERSQGSLPGIALEHVRRS